MDRNLPATRSETALTETDARPSLPRRQPLSVAFLPLALVAFIILAFAIAAWTFLSAAT
ncbi:MAG: hypothetical protein H0W98_04325 [Chloroflexi bacterium]|nr:hypothetical protein [Chloroflexota bacterium]